MADVMHTHKDALIRCLVGSGVFQARCLGVECEMSEICIQLSHIPYVTSAVMALRFCGDCPVFLFCFILCVFYVILSGMYWFLNMQYTTHNIFGMLMFCFSLFNKKKKSVPLAQASPPAFTSVIWSCCVPSSSITATEKPIDINN